jgi:hypothetical protein
LDGKWAVGLAGAVGYISANSISAHSSFTNVFRYEEPVKPPCVVSVVAPGWFEPDRFLQTSLGSLRKQSVVQRYPEVFDFIFVGCEGVNLQIPAKLGYRILCAPQGKLTARHLGNLAAEGDIIVAVDTDSIYPPNWLNINQRSLEAMMAEEEVGFKKKLERLGKVVLVDAPVIHLGEGAEKRGLHTYPRGKRVYAS